jgi:hypothetical protein
MGNRGPPWMAWDGTGGPWTMGVGHPSIEGNSWAILLKAQAI